MDPKEILFDVMDFVDLAWDPVKEMNVLTS
jgi:hypothetical protein